MTKELDKLEAALDSDVANALAVIVRYSRTAEPYQDDMQPEFDKAVETIRAALTNSVPVEVVRKAMAQMMVAQDIFHHYGDLHQAKGTDEENEKAFVYREHAAALGKVIRELEPWVKEQTK